MLVRDLFGGGLLFVRVVFGGGLLGQGGQHGSVLGDGVSGHGDGGSVIGEGGQHVSGHGDGGSVIGEGGQHVDVAGDVKVSGQVLLDLDGGDGGGEDEGLEHWSVLKSFIIISSY